ATSSGSMLARPPGRAATASSNAFALRPDSTTVQPASPSARAVAKPMPVAPPVIQATRPAFDPVMFSPSCAPWAALLPRADEADPREPCLGSIGQRLRDEAVGDRTVGTQMQVRLRIAPRRLGEADPGLVPAHRLAVPV